MTELGDLQELDRLQGLLGSANPEDRARALARLNLLRGSSLTAVAHRAQELADDHQAVVPRPPRRSAVVAMAAAWMGLRSPMHPSALDQRFAGWFADAECHADLLPEFAPRLIATANDWLAEYEHLSSVSASDDEPRLVHFDTWATLVERYPHVSAVLSHIVAKWAALRAARLLGRHTRRVEDALDRGDIATAWNALREIESLSDPTAENTSVLREAIYALGKRKTDIESWRGELPVAPRSWQDLVRVHDAAKSGHRLAQMRGVPRAWAEDISRDLDGLRDEARGFVANRADACDSLDAIRGDVADLRAVFLGSAFEIDEEWLEPFSAAVVRVIEQAIVSAGDASDLRRSLDGAAAIVAILPAGGSRQMQETLRRVEAIAVAWVALESEDVLDAVPDGILPPRFAEALEKDRRIEESVQAVAEAMGRGITTAERIEACSVAIRALDEILAEAPRHAAARELKNVASASLALLLLDDRIERWDVEGLRSMAMSAYSDELYAGLLQALPALGDLAELRALSAGSLVEIAAWWALWRQTEAKLPAQKPDALRRTLGVIRYETATSVRRAAEEHRSRPSATIDEDRAAEAAVRALAVDLAVKDDLLALTERRSIHEAVVAAQNDGTSRLASFLRDNWGTVDRCLPWAEAVLLDAFERAWNEADDESLEALCDVAFRDRLSRGENERFKEWLDWRELERSLSPVVTPERARRLHAFTLGGNVPAPVVARRLSRVIDKWRRNEDDAALSWAHRIFAPLYPALFPGADPLLTFERKSLAQVESIVAACHNAAAVDEGFVRAHGSTLKQIEDGWDRLEQLLLAVPSRQMAAWPNPPAELKKARQLLGAFQKVVDSFALWARSDLRRAGEEWDRVRRLLVRDLADYPAVEPFERLLRKVEPLTRLTGLEQHLFDACRRCGSVAPADREVRDAFMDAARCLEAVIRTLRAGEPEGAFTTAAVTREYWREIPATAGDVLPAVTDGDLEALHRRLLQLHENDRLFREAIDTLWREQPTIGATGELDVEAHRGYLTRYPQAAPASLRARRLFEDFTARIPQRVILRKSRHLLPEWLQRYVDNIGRGVSPW